MISRTNNKVQIRAAPTLLLMCTLAFLLLFGNVLSACTTTISCRNYIPTVSFLGAFRNHDRMFVFVCTFYSIVIQVISLAVHSILHTSMSWNQRQILLFFGVCVSASLVGLSVVDEVNGLHFIRLDNFHIAFSLTLLIVSLIWGYSIYDSFAASTLNQSQEYWLTQLKRLLIFEFALGLVTMLEWHFAYTVYWNVLVNETVEALCEWTLIGVGLFAPVVVASILPDLKFTLSLSTPMKDLTF